MRMVLEGRVQGVGFRAWTRRQARQLGVRGWVRNRKDGAVELHAAGPPDALKELKDRMGRGPRLARVDRVSEEGSGQKLPPSGFEIRY